MMISTVTSVAWLKMSIIVLLCSFVVQHVWAQSVPSEMSCSQNSELLSGNQLDSTAGAFQIEPSMAVASLDECTQFCCENAQCNAVTFLMMELSNDCILLDCPDLAVCFANLIPSSFALSVVWSTKSQLSTDVIKGGSTYPVLDMFTEKSVIPAIGDEGKQSTIEMPSPTPWVQDTAPSKQNNIAPSSTTQLLADQEAIWSVQPTDNNAPGVTDVEMNTIATDAPVAQSTVVEVEPSPTPFGTESRTETAPVEPMAQQSPSPVPEQLYEIDDHNENNMEKSNQQEIYF